MKKLFAVIIILLLTFSFAGCGDTSSNSEGTDAPADNGSAPASEIIAGNVTGDTEDTITLLTADGYTFTFDKGAAEVIMPADGIMEGDSISVHYTGSLEESADIQTVTVTKIEVTHRE